MSVIQWGGAATLPRARPTPSRTPKGTPGMLAVDLPRQSPLQEGLVSERSSGTPPITSSIGTEFREVERPREAASQRAGISTFWLPVRPGETREISIPFSSRDPTLAN